MCKLFLMLVNGIFCKWQNVEWYNYEVLTVDSLYKIIKIDYNNILKFSDKLINKIRVM